MTANEDQIYYWNGVAGAKWVANQDLLDRLMVPLTECLIESAAPRRGELALDIGCGCGDLTLRLASAIGGDGYIRAVDVSRPMLVHAEARREALGARDLATIQWIAADAMTYRFPPVSDLVISRFGTMFFDDMPRAFANLRAAMADGGRFAFLTWRRRSEVEWMQAPMGWIASVLPTPEETLGEIGPFALADADATCRMLTEAGFEAVAAEKIDRRLVMGEGASDVDAVEDALTLLANTGPAAALQRDVEPDLREKVRDLMRENIMRHVQGGRVMLEGACWLYRGTA